ncbi:MAG: WD40-like Beta Propeller Repeat [Nocardioides sp.]|nr:WD40-like Beta Propeller Repeat [Nocardioides sp.]
MTHRSRGPLALLLLVLLVGLVGPVGTTQATPAEARTTVSDATVLHRVVWDKWKRGRKGIHLRSARTDGTGLRRIYDAKRGFVIQLTMDRAGRRVAFAPCCRSDRPALVVVPVRGGTVLEPLADHPRIEFVGGIGWSPDGRRLAFEGTSGHGGHRATTLWTIRPDGSGLTRVLRLPEPEEPDQGIINDALAWTPQGILYSDGKNLRSAWAGRSHVVLRRVFEVRISGDGSTIVTERYRGPRMSLWVGEPDGSEQRRLLVRGEPGVDDVYNDVTPSYDGATLLASWYGPPDESGQGGGSRLVTWQTGKSPRSGATLEMTGDSLTATWN